MEISIIWVWIKRYWKQEMSCYSFLTFKAEVHSKAPQNKKKHLPFVCAFPSVNLCNVTGSNPVLCKLLSVGGVWLFWSRNKKRKGCSLALPRENWGSERQTPALHQPQEDLFSLSLSFFLSWSSVTWVSWESSLSSFTLPQRLSPVQNCMCSAENVLHFFFPCYLKLHFIIFTGILILINNNCMLLGGSRHLKA